MSLEDLIQDRRERDEREAQRALEFNEKEFMRIAAAGDPNSLLLFETRYVYRDGVKVREAMTFGEVMLDQLDYAVTMPDKSRKFISEFAMAALLDAANNGHEKSRDVIAMMACKYADMKAE